MAFKTPSGSDNVILNTQTYIDVVEYNVEDVERQK